nr:unnamed protein product [Digitaria exilis]
MSNSAAKWAHQQHRIFASLPPSCQSPSSAAASLPIADCRAALPACLARRAHLCVGGAQELHCGDDGGASSRAASGKPWGLGEEERQMRSIDAEKRVTEEQEKQSQIGLKQDQIEHQKGQIDNHRGRIELLARMPLESTPRSRPPPRRCQARPDPRGGERSWNPRGERGAGIEVGSSGCGGEGGVGARRGPVACAARGDRARGSKYREA